jgi:DNA-binding HxlR family transcriptional regulator
MRVVAGWDECQLIKLYGLLGKKWSAPLLHNLSEAPISFNELRRMTHQKINPTLLSRRLQDFVRFRIARKTTADGRIVYTLTREGVELKRLLHEIKRWSIHANYALPAVCARGECLCSKAFKDCGSCCKK